MSFRLYNTFWESTVTQLIKMVTIAKDYKDCQ